MRGISKGHRGTHSLEAQQRRDRHKHLLTYSYRDLEHQEVVCTQRAIMMVEAELQKKFDFVMPMNVECGEVLVDAYGRGSFQRLGGENQK